MVRMRSVVVVDGGLRYAVLVSSDGQNRIGVSPPHLRTETNQISETLYSLGFIIADDE
jgi:hypothetical protein